MIMTTAAVEVGVLCYQDC